MSILIPGLKMPPTRGIQIIIDCGHVWVKPFGAKDPERWGSPAIELPPHGRLIDADAILAKYPDDIWTAQTDYAEGLRDAAEDIKTAPTIIAAEDVGE